MAVAIQAEQHASGRLLAGWLESACSVSALSQAAVSTPVHLGGPSATSGATLLQPQHCVGRLCYGPLVGCPAGLHSISGLFVLGWCNAYALHEQLALAWCGCALLYVLHGCHLCFLRQVASAVWFLQVRPCCCGQSSTALTGRETNGGNPLGVSSRSKSLLSCTLEGAACQAA